MEAQAQLAPYSYHTFLFPFLIQTNKQFLHLEHWKPEDNFEATFSELRQEELYWRYAAFEYFTETARKILFGRGTDRFPVRRYHFAPNQEELRGKLSYIIEKDGKPFTLIVNGIQLLLFGDDMGLLTFELENSDPNQSNLDAVNCINEYGRRVNLAYLCKRDTETGKISHPISADRVTLKTEGKAKQDYTYDPIAFLERLEDAFDASGDPKNQKDIKQLELRYTAPHVRDILSYPDPRGIEPKDISPLIDDRMFVCCIVCDPALGSECAQYDRIGAPCLQAELHPSYEQGIYRYLTSCDNADDANNTSSKLYRLLFVETSTSCRSRTMRRKLLERCVYDRWIDYGTLHGVSHHAMICVTGDPGKYPSIQASVINPFLTIYTEIAKIVLLQRACVLSISDRVSFLAQQFYAESQDKHDSLDRIQDIQERFVQLQSSLFLSEITTAEQGIELYEMLENELYVTENAKKLDAQLHNLYELANLQSDKDERERDRKLNVAVALFAIPALLLALWQCVSPFMMENYLCAAWGIHWVSIALTTICVIALPIAVFAKRRRR